MSEDSSREKILQQNMLNLFEYIEALESRLKVVEEELLRYDFGYDPVETLAKKLRDKETESGTKLWKDKFAMNKPDRVEENKYTQHPEVVSVKPLSPMETRKLWLLSKDTNYTYKDHIEKGSWKDIYNQQVAKDDKPFEPSQL